jgi:hypothetical protein
LEIEIGKPIDVNGGFFFVGKNETFTKARRAKAHRLNGGLNDDEFEK